MRITINHLLPSSHYRASSSSSYILNMTNTLRLSSSLWRTVISHLVLVSLLLLPWPKSVYSAVSVWTTTPLNPTVRLAPQPDLTFTADAC